MIEQKEEEKPIQRIFSWIKNLFVEKTEDAINEVLEIKNNANIMKTSCLIPMIRI